MQVGIQLVHKGMVVIKKIIILLVVVAITATVAYQMGWLSYKGERAYENTKEAVKDAIDK